MLADVEPDAQAQHERPDDVDQQRAEVPRAVEAGRRHVPQRRAGAGPERHEEEGHVSTSGVGGGASRETAHTAARAAARVAAT